MSDQFSVKWRQNRACARCRRLKMKCAFEDPSFSACKRCYAINVECSFDNDPTAKYAKKKNRKPTNKFVESVSPGITSESISGSKISEQITQLQALFKLVLTSLSSLEQDLAVSSSLEDDGTKKLTGIYNDIQVSSNKLNRILNSNNSLKQFQDLHPVPDMSDYPYIPFSANIVKEIVEKHQLISLEEFKIRHSFFLNEMLPYYPIISLSKNLQDFDYLYENDPLLLAACVYVTSINDNGLYSKIKQLYYKVTNEVFNQMLNYYLESFISYNVYIKSDNFTYQLVDLCLILSLWCLPTTASGHFKNQVNLLTGFNVSLCIDLGDVSGSFTGKGLTMPPILSDDSEARNRLRAFLSVYVSAGSLGLSLPRFKLVSWTRHHHSAVLLLLKQGEVDGVSLPSRNDRYLCYFAKVIRLGQEIFEYFSPSLIDSGISSVASRKNDVLFNNMLDPSNSPLSHLKFVLDNYEQRMYSLLIESGFMSSPDPLDNNSQPNEKYLLSIIYYQLLMIIYDNIVSRFFKFDSKLTGYKHGQEVETVTYIQYIVKLIKICENLLNSFIILGQQRTINVPTFFFYRPMHSLILLIKLRILINSLGLAKKTNIINPDDLIIDVETYFKGVYSLIHDSRQKYSLIVCLRMAIILSRIEKWMQVSNSNGKKPTTNESKSTDSRATSNLVRLIDTSREIENLRAPKEADLVSSETSPNSTSQPNSSRPQSIEFSHLDQSFVNSLDSGKRPLHEIFEVIDSDILSHLNPLDANMGFDSNFNDLANLDIMGYSDSTLTNIFNNSNDNESRNGNW